MRKNSTPIVLFFVIMAVASTLTLVPACTSFDPDDWFHMKNPLVVQKATGTPAKITLNEAEGVRSTFANGLAEFDENYSNTIAIKSFAYAAVGTAIEIGATKIQGGAIFLTFLAGLSTLFIEKPGTKAKKAQEDADKKEEIAEAKQKSFNEAEKRGQERFNQVLDLAKAAGVSIPESLQQ